MKTPGVGSTEMMGVVEMERDVRYMKKGRRKGKMRWNCGDALRYGILFHECCRLRKTQSITTLLGEEACETYFLIRHVEARPYVLPIFLHRGFVLAFLLQFIHTC